MRVFSHPLTLALAERGWALARWGWSYVPPCPPLPIAVLVATTLIYGLFGSPTPDALGWPEAVLALGLLFSVGARGGRSALEIDLHAPLWLSVGRIFALWGTAVGLLVALASANGPVPMLRDLIAFWLLVLPVFLWPHISAAPERVFPWLVGAACFSGLAFAARTLGLVPGLRADDLFYLSNAPTVLFATVFLGGLAGALAFRGRRGDAFLAIALSAAAVIPILAMTSNLQRATVGAVAMCGVVLATAHMIRQPRRGAVILVLGGAALVFAMPGMGGLLAQIAEKSEAVGLNRRGDELAAVWDAVAAQPWTLALGLGWGGTFASPAVGGLSVNFTHSLLSSALLKTGLVGLTLTVAYIGALGAWCARLVRVAPVLGLALAMPLLIDTLLYASYKSFDFGLTLALIPAACLYLRRAREGAP